MDIHITHSAPAATATTAPDFPLVRFDTGLVVYQEALINGQYLVAHASAMGRSQTRAGAWARLNSASTAWYAHVGLSTRHHAFQIEMDGQLLVDRWEWAGSHEVEASRPGCREAVVTLRHTQRPVTVAVHTRLDDTSFLARWLVITNTSDRPSALSHIYPWSGQVWEVRPWDATGLYSHFAAPFRLGRFTNSSAGAEGSYDWMPLPDGLYGYESRMGRSGWGAPFFILSNVVTGENLVGHFAWSGNWQIEFFNDHEPARRPERGVGLYAQVGLAGPAPLRVLEPGESAHTPEVHLGFLFGDLDACVQALHTHERRSVILPQPPGREHRVEVNHTGYTRNAQLTKNQLHEEIAVAADVGVELFMLDAGWYGEATRQWFETVGDWDQENPLLQPGGLKAIFDYARARGMLVGLWVEAERMGPASRLLRDHPGWQMARRGAKIPNLDLSKPEVARYMEDTITGLIEKYELDCFRLDYNPWVGDGGEAQRGGYTENVLWRYYDALYGIFDRLHQRFPNLLLENCAGGGGRADLGMMSRSHWTQVSDRWSPDPTLKIINGMTLSLPPELCMTLLGAISDGVSDIDFLLRIGLFGHLCLSGIFPIMSERHAVAREHWRHAIHVYKTFVRPILSSCRMFHHTPVQRLTEAGKWVVLECASEDRSRG
ncbi:MAG: alpha-galactosidase, partial [Anaerolineae bacterium]|nr:alpha-galactosidase [Anaerolineae bacterium]